MATAPSQPRERELEPEEEEQEDDSELGDELRHLGLADEGQLLGLVRAEQEPGEEVGGDRGQPDPPSDEAEHAQHGDGDGELGEGHRAILTAEPRGRWGRAAYSVGRTGGNRSSTHPTSSASIRYARPLTSA